MTTEIATTQPTGLAPAEEFDFRALKEFADYVGDDPWGVYARMAKMKAYGLNPAHYDECIDILDIQGRKQFSLTTKAMGALCKSHPRYDYSIVKFEDDEAQIKFFDKELGVEHVHSMTRKQADEAGYSKTSKGIKDQWKKQPALMLFYRCLSQGIRVFCPDVLGGANAYDQDEIPKVIEAEYREVIDGGVPPTPSTPPPSKSLPTPSALEKAISWCRAGVGSASYTASKGEASVNKALSLVADLHGVNPDADDAWSADWSALDVAGKMAAVIEFHESGKLPDLTAGVIDAQTDVETF